MIPPIDTDGPHSRPGTHPAEWVLLASVIVVALALLAEWLGWI